MSEIPKSQELSAKNIACLAAKQPVGTGRRLYLRCKLPFCFSTLMLTHPQVGSCAPSVELYQSGIASLFSALADPQCYVVSEALEGLLRFLSEFTYVLLDLCHVRQCFA